MDRALSFLANAQSTDGGFRTEVSSAPRLVGARRIESPYLHAIVADALAAMEPRAPAATPMLRRADAYLARTQESDGWWRFFGPAFPERLPDLDTTSVSYAARLVANPGDERIATQANAWLDSLEPLRAECGLFKTWRDPEINAHDFELPDSMVNANVLLLQGLLKRPDPRLIAFFHHIATRSTYHILNRWGVARFAVPYLIARAFARGAVTELEGTMNPIIAWLRHTQHADGGWGSDLETALAVMTLLSAGAEGPRDEESADWLLARQQPDGGWATGTFFRDMLPEFYGARVFTTVVCAQAIATVLGRFVAEPMQT